MLSYRKTKSGEWVIYGPKAEMWDDMYRKPVGYGVTVTKASGETKKEYIDRLGKPFTVDGTEMAYGYIAKAPSSGHSHAARCDECGKGAARFPRYDSSGIPGTVCGRCDSQPDAALSFA